MAIYYDEVHKTYYCKFRYTDWTGKSRHTSKRGFRTKREAKAYEYEFKCKAAESPEMTVRSLCERFLADKKSRVRKSTYDTLASLIKHFIYPTIGDMKVSDIKKSTIISWQSWVLSCRQRDGTKFSQATERRVNSLLSQIISYAIRLEIVNTNPASMIPKIGKMRKRTGFWEESEYLKFISAVDDDKYRLCFDVLFYSGMRIAEFYGLGRSSFDFQKNTIYIKQALTNRVLHQLKTDTSNRVIPMPDVIMKRIKEYLDALDEVPEYGVMPYRASLLRKYMMKTAKQAGLKYITLHGLRHSHASQLISMGIPLTVISKRLGHSSPKITLDVYSHLYKEDDTMVSKLLNDRIVGQSLVKCEREPDKTL